MTNDVLRQMFASSEAVLFDFDGPICSVFYGYPAPQITRELRDLSKGFLGYLPDSLAGSSGPHDLLMAASPDRQLAGLLEGALQAAELKAVQTALPTPGASEALAVCKARGKLVAIVSNNYAGAVADYLNRQGLTAGISHVEGRDSMDPELMKPSPHLLERTVRALEVHANNCIFIGDQATDIEAGRAAGIRTIGYANKPGKAAVLSEAGADAVIDSMTKLAGAIA